MNLPLTIVVDVQLLTKKVCHETFLTILVDHVWIILDYFMGEGSALQAHYTDHRPG